MTGMDLTGDDTDVERLTAAFPGWCIARTEHGWWATRGPLTSETLSRVVAAPCAAELSAALEAATR